MSVAAVVITPRTIARRSWLRERAVPVDLHDEHYVARLIERVAWALHDAERLESRASVGAGRPDTSYA